MSDVEYLPLYAQAESSEALVFVAGDQVFPLLE